MHAKSELATLFRLTPVELQAVLQTGYLTRERHRGGYRHRLRFRIAGRLCSRYLALEYARAGRTRELLHLERTQQALQSVDAPRFSRLARLALTTVRQANRARDRPASEPARFPLSWQRFISRAAEFVSFQEKGIVMTSASHESPDTAQEATLRDEGNQPTIPLEPAVAMGNAPEQQVEAEPIPETTAAEWCQTADSLDQACVLDSNECDEEPDVSSSAGEQQSPSAVPPEAVAPTEPRRLRYPGLVRLDEYDDQQLASTPTEAWIRSSIRRHCEAIVYMVARASKEKLAAADDVIETEAVIAPVMSRATKLMKEIAKLKEDGPPSSPRSGRGTPPPGWFQ